MIIEELNTRSMSIIQNIISCMRGYRSGAYRSGKSMKIKFGVPLSKISVKSCQHLPSPLFELLVYLAQEGIKTRDMFRRPGNSIQMKKIIEMLSDGADIEWHNYNIYTVANVAKKYFISLPGGLFGTKFEMLLLATHSLSDDDRRVTFLRILHQLPLANKELTILMFGILFRMVSHAVDEYTLETKNERCADRLSNSECTESVLAEAVAKSVAGSIFHLCTSCPENVEKAAFVLRGLILDFPSFDEEFVDFYYRSTLVSYGGQCSTFFKFPQSQNVTQHSNFINGLDQVTVCNSNTIQNKKKSINLCSQTPNVPTVTITNVCGDEESISTNSSPLFKGNISKDDDNLSLRSSRSYDKVQQRQKDQMRLRSDWFLNSGSCNNLNSTLQLSYNHYDEESIIMSPDRQLQYQIIATSGPDILQRIPKWKQNTKIVSNFSHNLTVPNQYDVGSVISSQMSSCGNNSRSSFLDEVYSDF